MYTTWASRISIQHKNWQLRHKKHAERQQHSLIKFTVYSHKLKPRPQPYPYPQIQKIKPYTNSTKISSMAPPTTSPFVHSIAGAPLRLPSSQLMGIKQQLSYDTHKEEWLLDVKKRGRRGKEKRGSKEIAKK